MAKFPTEVERSIAVQAPLAEVYRHFWDVVGTARHISGLRSCEPVGKEKDTYRFVYEPRTHAGISVAVRYTSRYAGNETDRITYESISAKGDSADVKGTIRLQSIADDKTRIVLKQMMAAEVPVPSLMGRLVKPIVEREQTEGLQEYLANVKRALEGRG